MRPGKSTRVALLRSQFRERVARLVAGAFAAAGAKPRAPGRSWQVSAFVLHQRIVLRGLLARAADLVARPEGVEVAPAAQASAESCLGAVVVAVAPRQGEPAGFHRDGGGPAIEPLRDLLVGEVAQPHLNEDALLLAGPQAVAHGAAAGLGGRRLHRRCASPGGSAYPGPAVDDAPLAEGPDCSVHAGRVRGKKVAAGQREIGGLHRDRVRRALEPLGDLLAGAVGQPHFDENILVSEGPANQPLRAAGLLAASGWAVS